MGFSSDRANKEFAEKFAAPARALLSKEIPDAAVTYANLGKLWASTEQEIAGLTGTDAHVAAVDSSLDADVKDSVHSTLAALWAELKPMVGPSGATTHALRNRPTSIEKHHGIAMRGAAAYAAAAADRAAAVAFQGNPVVHSIMTPTVQKEEPETGYRTPREQAGSEEPDLVDKLLARMTGQPEIPEQASGKDAATKATQPAAVPPSLAAAANRLTAVGCPPFRVEKMAAALAQHILQRKPTFTEWVESKGLSGAALREALTEARALDLGTAELGAKFLLSSPAEVLIRRLLSIALAQKMGSYRVASLLEELPGDNALAELPDVIMKAIGERLKLEMKIEQSK